MFMRKIIAVVLGGVMATSLFSCNGIFDGIYDDSVHNAAGEYGFVEPYKGDAPGKVFVNAEKYDKWVYISFHKQTVSSGGVSDNDDNRSEWDIALHRYDVKTNGAAAMMTEYSNLVSFLHPSRLPQGNYVEDRYAEKSIIVDISKMMEEGPEYSAGYSNEVLSSWLDVNTSQMPPTYTLSNRVYVVKFKDGTSAALQFSDYKNKDGDKGFVTINYVYPLLKKKI